MNKLWMMIFTIACLIQTVTAPTLAKAQKNSHPIVGIWHFVGYMYDGHELPKPNPELEIIFEFHADKTNRLFWFRHGQTGFCDRQGQYDISETHIEELVVWVNPENNFNCSKDPDMQMGRQAKFPYRFNGERLETRVYVGDMDVWYIWERTPPKLIIN